MEIPRLYSLLRQHYNTEEWWPSRFSNKNNRAIDISIGALLTQNTNWKNVEKALYFLYESTEFDINKLLKLGKEKIKEMIKPVGYYNQKSEALIELLNFLKYNLKNLFKDNITAVRQDLLEIKRIGKETADSILLYAFNRPIFVVDSYTKRLFYRLGIIPFVNIDYDHLRLMVEKSFRKKIKSERTKIYKQFHAAIIEHSKKLCLKKPRCEKCFLNIICLKK